MEDENRQGRPLPTDRDAVLRVMPVAIGDVVSGTADRGRITVRTRLEAAETVVVAITDTGTGIPEAIRDRVFDPFFAFFDRAGLAERLTDWRRIAAAARQAA